MILRTGIAASALVFGLLLGGPEMMRSGVTVPGAQAQSLRSIVRRITRPVSRKRARTSRRSRTRRNEQTAPQRQLAKTAPLAAPLAAAPAQAAVAAPGSVNPNTPPIPPTANPRRLANTHAVGGPAAVAAGVAGAAAATGAANAFIAKPSGPIAAANTAAEPPPAKPWSEAEVVDALRACVQLLAPHGIAAKPAAAIRSGACGDPAPVTLERIGRGAKAVTFEPAVTLNCPMAARLARWLETEAQPAAEAAFGARIKRISGANGYACRNRNGAKTARLSEHALANAIDIPMFVLENDQRVSVLGHWGKRARADRLGETGPAAGGHAPRKPQKRAAPAADLSDFTSPPTVPLRNPVRRGRTMAEARAIITASFQPGTSGPSRKARRALGSKPSGVSDGLSVKPAMPAKTAQSIKPMRPADEAKLVFLKSLHTSACTMFGTVLGPDANAAHEDHFHFDLASRRRSAYCR